MGFSDLLAMGDRTALSLLGSSITYAPSVGAPVTVTGIFDTAYLKVDAGHPGVSSFTPAVFLRLADLPSDPGTDAATITADSVSYSIRETQKDGQGGVLLLLHKV